MKGQPTRLTPVTATAGGASLTRPLPGQGFGVGRVPTMTRLWVMAGVVASVAVIGLSGAPSVATGVLAPVSKAPEMGLGTLSLAAQAPVASALGRADRAYWVRGSSARNPAQHLRIGLETGYWKPPGDGFRYSPECRAPVRGELRPPTIDAP